MSLESARVSHRAPTTDPSAEDSSADGAAATHRVGPGACVLLGAAATMAAVTLPDAILMPAVDRAAPRAAGLATLGVLLSVGWWLAAGRTRMLGRRQVLLIGAAAVAGGFAAAALLPLTTPLLDTFLRTGGARLYYPAIVLASALVSAPLAVPLGALVGIVTATPRRWILPLLLFGGASGFALAPYLGEVLLGRQATLQTCAMLAGAAAVIMGEVAPLAVHPRRLPAGGAPAFLAGGAGLALTWRLVFLATDRGTLGLPFFLALIALGAAFGAVAGGLGRAPRWPLYGIACWAAAVTHLLPIAPHVSGFGGSSLVADMLYLAVSALPWGLVLGASLTCGLPEGDAPVGPRLTWVPLLLLAPAPALLLLGLPGAAPRDVGLMLGGLVLLVLLVRRQWPRPDLIVVLPLLLPLVTPPLEPPAAGLVPLADRHTSDGLVARYFDPLTAREAVAVDGRAFLGRSAAQERRFVHLPLLLGGGPLQRVLLVNDLHGEETRAVFDHDVIGELESDHRPPFVWSLSPFPLPPEFSPGTASQRDTPDERPSLFREVASERQFLTEHTEPYDAILLAPDPRARRRVNQLGTSEFFELCRDRLADDGVFCQWWDLSAVDVSDLKSVVASAHQVFEHVYVILDHPRTRHGVAGILGRHHPLVVDVAAVNTAIALRPAVEADLSPLGLDGLLLGCLVVADKGVLQLIAPREDGITDDRPRLGARGGVRTLARPTTLRVGLSTWAGRRHDAFEWLAVPEQDREGLELHVRDIHRGWQHLYGTAQTLVAQLADEFGAVPPFDLESPGEFPDDEAAALLQCLSSLADWDYLAAEISARAERLAGNGRMQAAEATLREAIARDQGSADFRAQLGALLERTGEPGEALTLYRSALFFDPEHEQAEEAVTRLEAQNVVPEAADDAASGSGGG